MYDIGFYSIISKLYVHEIQGSRHTFAKKGVQLQKYDVKEENGEIYIDV